MPAQTVRDVMTTDVVRLQVDTTLVDAGRVMRDKDIGDVVVVEDERLIGVVTDRDIVVRAVAEGLGPDTTTVGAVVSKDLVTVRPDDTVLDVARLMRDRAGRRGPVRGEQGPPGVVSVRGPAVGLGPASGVGGGRGGAPHTPTRRGGAPPPPPPPRPP